MRGTWLWVEGTVIAGRLSAEWLLPLHCFAQVWCLLPLQPFPMETLTSFCPTLLNPHFKFHTLKLATFRVKSKGLGVSKLNVGSRDGEKGFFFNFLPRNLIICICIIKIKNKSEELTTERYIGIVLGCSFLIWDPWICVKEIINTLKSRMPPPVDVRN